MPKRGMFRTGHRYQHLESELAGKAFAGLYALHGYLFKKEARHRRRRARR